MKKGLKITIVSLAAIVLILVIAIALLIKSANKIIKYELEVLLGKDFSVRNIELHWGKVEAFDISFKNPAGKEVLKTERLILEANFLGLLRKEYVLSKLILKSPYIFLETDPKGNLVFPFPRKAPERGKPEKPTPPLLIKRIDIIEGSIDYLDRKVSTTPVLTKLRDIDLEFKDLSVPFSDRFSTYILSASIPGNMSTGTLRSNGRIKLKTKDMDSTVDVRKLDVTQFKPYYQKSSDVNVTKGILDLQMDVKIQARKINAPGTATLKALEFETGTGVGNTFLSIPRSAVINFLKSNNNEIVVTFVLEGDLDNPRFNLQNTFMQKITIALAEKLGLSVRTIGESVVVLGAEGAKQIEKSVKGIGESLKEILKR